ncbi:HNH endonuclease, partial [Candidatus Micrarchaeota archaeon]|nr:HNH endonuclease [Candidatus Micrarchaeota archaeon]
MSFNETIKLQIKHQAAFQCCRCHDIGVEVHHILPEAEGGPDEFDNGAPLCPSCHSNFGGNPDKRKEIRQMRDFWYAVVKEKQY